MEEPSEATGNLPRGPALLKEEIAMPGEARNVILIISDTLRRDCVSVYGEPGWFGKPVRTPHLERFAARATVFDRAFSSSFPTVPLRNDILTGRATFTYKQWAPLDRDDATLQET